MMIRALVGGILLAAGSMQPLPQPPIDTPHVTIATGFDVKTAARPGGKVSLFVDITPKPKMHLYAPEQKDYIPVSLTLAEDPSFKADAPKFPKGEKYFFEPLKETQVVFSKPFRVTQGVTIAPAAALGDRATLTISGTLRYQACDEAICYLPKNVPVSWTIPVRRAPEDR